MSKNSDTMSELYVEENDSNLPKIHVFVKELTNWLGLFAICMFVIYGILQIIYEVALDLTHVRWAFTAFLVCCAIDVITYWICRYAVSDASGRESLLLRLVLVAQIITGLYYLVAPILVQCTYRFSPEKSMIAGEKILEQNQEKLEHTLEDYVDPDPCRESEGNIDKEPLWQCGYVRSIKTAAWCMWISLCPKFLICYLLVRILRSLQKLK